MNHKIRIWFLAQGAGLLLLTAACGLLTNLPGAPAEDSAGLLVDAPGVSAITLITAQTAAGPQPLLAWEPVEAARLYQVTVYTPEKHTYWAWSGTQTSVYLGGGHTPPPQDSAGPALSAGMWWTVLALDADGRIVGSSALQSISP